MTGLAHDKQRGLRRMADESVIFTVAAVGRRPITGPITGPVAARHGVAHASCLRGSWGLR